MFDVQSVSPLCQELLFLLQLVLLYCSPPSVSPGEWWFKRKCWNNRGNHKRCHNKVLNSCPSADECKHRHFFTVLDFSLSCCIAFCACMCVHVYVFDWASVGRHRADESCLSMPCPPCPPPPASSVPPPASPCPCLLCFTGGNESLKGGSNAPPACLVAPGSSTQDWKQSLLPEFAASWRGLKIQHMMRAGFPDCLSIYLLERVPWLIGTYRNTLIILKDSCMSFTNVRNRQQSAWAALALWCTLKLRLGMEVLFVLNKYIYYSIDFIRSNKSRWIGGHNLSCYPLLYANGLPLDFVEFVCSVSHKTIIKGNSQLDKPASPPSQHTPGAAQPSRHAATPAHRQIVAGRWIMARISFLGETSDLVDQSHQLLLVLLPPDKVSLDQRLQLSWVPFLVTSCVMSFGVQNKIELGARFGNLSKKRRQLNKKQRHTEVAADIVYCWGLSAAKIESITHIKIDLLSPWLLWHSGWDVLKLHSLGYWKKQKQNKT